METQKTALYDYHKSLGAKFVPFAGYEMPVQYSSGPDRIRYFGDPISAMDFNAKTVIPSFGFRWNNSAHSYKDLFIKDAVPLHDTMKNMLEPSPDDSKAEVISY